MSLVSDYLAGKVVDVMRNTAFSGISGLHLALFNGDPGPAGASATEITTTIRTAGRVAITLNAASNGVTSNAAEVDFGISQATTTVGGWGIYDASTSGNLLLYGGLTPTIQVLINQTLKIPGGSLSVDLS